jgi:galactosylceramidase
MKNPICHLHHTRPVEPEARRNMARRALPAALAALLCCLALSLPSPARADQSVNLKGDAGGKRFDGIGAVSGGGATSVLLKDYPEPQRSQILDLLFKPKFGGSMSTLLVEVPGDGNSTQGSELSHEHTKDDLNYSRGYEWWLMREAKKRNPALTLDACAWSCPAWVGNGNFWSQDMCDYYTKWIQGLKSVYGLDLDAIGCRNEKGDNLDWVKKFRATLDAAGLQKVRIHGFDNWQNNKFDFVRRMSTDQELKNAVAIFSAHTMATSPTPADVRQISDTLNKPIWNTEEHVYKEGFDCEISIVQAFNQNYIVSGVTKILCWYLVASVYPMEPYPETPASLMANSPWSGHYAPRLALWGYAHYGQFSEVGWQYLNGACGKLDGGGTYVTLKSPGNDYSVILETKGARTNQNVTFNISGGLSTGQLCVWRSNEREQFVKQPAIGLTIKHLGEGSFTLALEPQSIYSISTTTGQQKGSFDNIPAETRFPFPYYETFDEYTQPKQFGYLPHYTADIASGFEIAERPDKTGMCLRQVVAKKPQSWAPEWMPYTIIGDRDWTDYEVSADICLVDGGSAGVMGRVNSVGTGYGCVAKGYYLRLDADGTCSLFLAGQSGGRGAAAAPPEGTQLATAKVDNMAANPWHNLKLRLSGQSLTGFVDGVEVLSATNSASAKGMAGLIAGSSRAAQSTALYDNLLINAVGAPAPKPTLFPASVTPMYNR